MRSSQEVNAFPQERQLHTCVPWQLCTSASNSGGGVRVLTIMEDVAAMLPKSRGMFSSGGVEEEEEEEEASWRPRCSWKRWLERRSREMSIGE